eukprot:TRINITY_DN38773_c0_g1_i1.p1 TRINITY_DN38773_c0_g1~~TRINITY_DN38773_c0_g1_i1.p1  ORF type:complete len:1009 (+),score=160.56 TRINITY_DN38773_c0_g1_i1:297-3029(+)
MLSFATGKSDIDDAEDQADDFAVTELSNASASFSKDEEEWRYVDERANLRVKLQKSLEEVQQSVARRSMQLLKFVDKKAAIKQGITRSGAVRSIGVRGKLVKSKPPVPKSSDKVDELEARKANLVDLMSFWSRRLEAVGVPAREESLSEEVSQRSSPYLASEHVGCPVIASGVQTRQQQKLNVATLSLEVPWASHSDESLSVPSDVRGSAYQAEDGNEGDVIVCRQSSWASCAVSQDNIDRSKVEAFVADLMRMAALRERHDGNLFEISKVFDNRRLAIIRSYFRKALTSARDTQELILRAIMRCSASECFPRDAFVSAAVTKLVRRLLVLSRRHRREMVQRSVWQMHAPRYKLRRDSLEFVSIDKQRVTHRASIHKARLAKSQAAFLAERKTDIDRAVSAGDVLTQKGSSYQQSSAYERFKRRFDDDDVDRAFDAFLQSRAKVRTQKRSHLTEAALIEEGGGRLGLDFVVWGGDGTATASSCVKLDARGEQGDEAKISSDGSLDGVTRVDTQVAVQRRQVKNEPRFLQRRLREAPRRTVFQAETAFAAVPATAVAVANKPQSLKPSSDHVIDATSVSASKARQGMTPISGVSLSHHPKARMALVGSAEVMATAPRSRGTDVRADEAGLDTGICSGQSHVCFDVAADSDGANPGWYGLAVEPRRDASAGSRRPRFLPRSRFAASARREQRLPSLVGRGIYEGETPSTNARGQHLGRNKLADKDDREDPVAFAERIGAWTNLANSKLPKLVAPVANPQPHVANGPNFWGLKQPHFALGLQRHFVCSGGGGRGTPNERQHRIPLASVDVAFRKKPPHGDVFVGKDTGDKRAQGEYSRVDLAGSVDSSHLPRIAGRIEELEWPPHMTVEEMQAHLQSSLMLFNRKKDAGDTLNSGPQAVVRLPELNAAKLAPV